MAGHDADIRGLSCYNNKGTKHSPAARNPVRQPGICH